MLILTVLQGPDRGKKFELPDHEPQLVGRSSEALPIADSTVSRRHAELTPDEGRWYIRDLGSQNGTWVNGFRIRGRTMLKPGDQVRTGATLFVFGFTDDAEADLVRIVRPSVLDTAVEKTLASNDDSIILAEPEPRNAAMHHLQVIYRLTALTTHLLENKALLEGVMNLVFTEFKPERGCILLADPSNPKQPPRPVIVKHKGIPRDKQDAQIVVSRTILQYAMTKGEGVLSSNAMTDPRFRAGDSVQQFNIRSAICSPIEFGETRFGAIYIDSSIANYTFTPEQLALMNAIGRHTGLAVANAQAYAKKVQNERLAAVGQTVAAVSHSIKNILQGLRGGADVVEMGLKKDDLKIARGGWAILKRNLDRIMGLTQNMLAYSRASSTLEIELTRVQPLLEDCASLLKDQCDARQVALLIDADPEMPPIPMDSNLMHQALMNLMGNAVEAVAAHTGVVTVRAGYQPAAASQGRPQAEARISISDNGPGITPDRRDQLFEPFYSTKGSRGTGLGLAVAKRIIEDHGGTILVESGALLPELTTGKADDTGAEGAGGDSVDLGDSRTLGGSSLFGPAPAVYSAAGDSKDPLATVSGKPMAPVGGGATFTIVLPVDTTQMPDPSATAAQR